MNTASDEPAEDLAPVAAKLTPYTPRFFYQGILRFGILYHERDRKITRHVYDSLYISIVAPYLVNLSLIQLSVNKRRVSDELVECNQDLVPLLKQVLS
jgi:hypothetical protein